MIQKGNIIQDENQHKIGIYSFLLVVKLYFSNNLHRLRYHTVYDLESVECYIF